MSYVKIGVGGPVGSGKTALIERLTREMSKEYSICVVTNDIYTKEDAEFLTKNSCLPADRIVGVETGGCPHTAIREDCSMNLEAVDEMVKKHPDTLRHKLFSLSRKLFNVRICRKRLYFNIMLCSHF